MNFTARSDPISRGALNNLLKVSEWSFSKSRRAESERALRTHPFCSVPGAPHFDWVVGQPWDKRVGAPLGHHKRARTAAGAKRAGPVEISPLHPRPHPARARATPTDTRPSRCLRIPRVRRPAAAWRRAARAAVAARGRARERAAVPGPRDAERIPMYGAPRAIERRWICRRGLKFTGCWRLDRLGHSRHGDPARRV